MAKQLLHWLLCKSTNYIFCLVGLLELSLQLNTCYGPFTQSQYKTMAGVFVHVYFTLPLCCAANSITAFM